MRLLTVVAIVTCFANIDLLPLEKSGCIINIKSDLTYKHPLILKPKIDEFIYPHPSGGLRFDSGEKIRLACPGNHLNIAASNVQEVEATCISGNNFNVTGISGTKPFIKLNCQNYPSSEARATKRKCLDKYTEIDIGFKVKSGFIRTITTCFNDVTKDSLYSTYNLTNTIGEHQSKVPRPNSFQSGNFYLGMSPTVVTSYTMVQTLNTFSKILGSPAEAEKYIKPNSEGYYFSRGHFTANADFVYASQQRATFYYMNVAPQWQIFNAINWNILEMNVRSYASKYKNELIVYTGVWNVSSLPDKNGDLQKLYLYVNGNDRKLTVPEVYWKVIYDPNSKAGVGFIGHNNPYEKNVTKICTDVSDKITWLHWHASNITEGYSYCCTVPDLKSQVDNLPDLPVLSLLV